MLCFHRSLAAPPTPVAKNAQAFYRVGLGEQLSGHRLLQRLSRTSRRRTFRALLADRQSQSTDTAVIAPLLRAMKRSGSPSPAGRSKTAGISQAVMADRDGPALDLADIQGFVLRGYHDADAAAVPVEGGGLRPTPRRQLGRLVSGDESDVPQITTAADWHVGFASGSGGRSLPMPPHRSPDYCLNIGITWPGLVALEVEERVPTLSFRSFGAFVEGAAQRADLVGDIGASAPEQLGRRLRKWRRSRPGDAARHQPSRR